MSTYRIPGLIGRILELTPRATAHDAAYVALAETLDCPLVTLSGPVRSLTGVSCEFPSVKALPVGVRLSRSSCRPW